MPSRGTLEPIPVMEAQTATLPLSLHICCTQHLSTVQRDLEDLLPQCGTAVSKLTGVRPDGVNVNQRVHLSNFSIHEVVYHILGI